MATTSVVSDKINSREVSFRLAVVRLVASLVRPAGVPASVKCVAIIFLALAVFGSFVAVLFLATLGAAMQLHKDFDSRPYLIYYSVNSVAMLLLAVLVIPKLQESADTKQYSNKMNAMFEKKSAAMESQNDN